MKTNIYAENFVFSSTIIDINFLCVRDDAKFDTYRCHATLHSFSSFSSSLLFCLYFYRLENKTRVIYIYSLPTTNNYYFSKKKKTQEKNLI